MQKSSRSDVNICRLTESREIGQYHDEMNTFLPVPPYPVLLPNEHLTNKLSSSTNSGESAEKYSDGHLRYLLIGCTWAAAEKKMLQKKNAHSLTSLFVE